jgi:hypothetical protein
MTLLEKRKKERKREREKKELFVKITNTKFHENLSVGNLVTPHRNSNESISPF